MANASRVFHAGRCLESSIAPQPTTTTTRHPARQAADSHQSASPITAPIAILCANPPVPSQRIPAYPYS